MFRFDTRFLVTTCLGVSGCLVVLMTQLGDYTDSVL